MLDCKSTARRLGDVSHSQPRLCRPLHSLSAADLKLHRPVGDGHLDIVGSLIAAFAYREARAQRNHPLIAYGHHERSCRILRHLKISFSLFELDSPFSGTELNFDLAVRIERDLGTVL